MDFIDKTLTCKDCGKEFVWSAGEQQFYAEKGLNNPPGRCPDCRKKMKAQKINRPAFSITCKNCGKVGEAKFEPKDPRDILCAECWDKKVAAGLPRPDNKVETGKPADKVA